MCSRFVTLFPRERCRLATRVRFQAIVLVLLFVPAFTAALAPAAGAQQPLPPGITIMEATRVENNLTLDVRANRDFYNSVIRLVSGGTTAGLPQWEKASWRSGERASWTFTLLKDLDTVTVVHDFYEGQGAYRHQEENIFVPKYTTPSPESPSTARARLVVTGAALATTSLRVDVLNHGDAAAEGLVVSLEDASNRKIGIPFARTVGTLAAGASTSARFDVDETLENVVVALSWANTTERTSVKVVRNATGASAGDEANVTLSTELPFREADIGRTVDYAVTVRNGGRPALVQIGVEGLASGYSARFFVGGSAVPSLYLDRNQTRQVTLSITVPNDADEVDRTLDFSVVARANETELARLAMGVAVRGVGSLVLGGASGEASVPPGGGARFDVTVRNAGTAPLFDVEFDSRRPYGWTVRTEPRRVDRLDPGEVATAIIEVRAPDVIGGGRYTVDVAARAGDVASRYQSLPVVVVEPEEGGALLWVAFLVGIAGILGAGAWWKWRG